MLRLMIRGWRGAVAAALVVSGCARPCLDDGFLAMQHDDGACVATGSSSTGAATTSGEPTSSSSGSTGPCGCTTGSESTGAESTGGGKFDVGSKMDMGALCGDGDVDGDELCDDGNSDDLDICNGWCKPTPLAIEATAADSLAIEGGAGGTPFADACPPGEVLIGFEGDIDDQGRIGRLFGACASLLVIDDGVQFVTAAGPTSELPVRGMMNTGGPFMSLCGTSSAVVGFSGRESMSIDQLVIRCAKIDIVESMGDYSLVFGSVEELAPAGMNIDGVAFAEHDCPPGQVASGQTGQAGQVVDGFGLECATLSLVL